MSMDAGRTIGAASANRASRKRAAASSLRSIHATTPLTVIDPGLPPAQGLYDPRNEHDACGVGFVADMKNRKSHKIVAMGLQILANLDHRGAVGADAHAGDGCGMLVQIPHAFFAAEAERLGIDLPAEGDYGVGFFFLPRDPEGRRIVEDIVAKAVADEGQVLLGWRDVPVDPSLLGESVKAGEPVSRQLFVGRGEGTPAGDAFERRLFILRKVISGAVYGLTDGRTAGFYPVSMSSRTIVYKGLLLVTRIGRYYKDLGDERFASALALVHQRFSTNTFPSWSLSHPYRMVAHNGEINTLRGNVNWMAARQASVTSERYGQDISKLWPISYEGQSDTACFDNALEFLVQGGYSLAHAMMMLIPEAWAGNPLMDESRRSFYEYHAALMEPWDGPAAVAFTDGRQIGATLDRNGLRPARYLVTDDDLVVLASEMGVLPIPEESIVKKWRLQPGKMLLVDLEQGRIVSDDEMKSDLAASHPYRAWLDQTQIVLEKLQPVEARAARTDVSLLDKQQAYGYTQEDLTILLAPMAATGQEAVGSMGTDTPISVLSDKGKLLYTYFQQNFAQVTNPPIDPIREELVMSLVSFIGPRPNIFDLAGNWKRKRLEVRQPILTNDDLEKIRCISYFEDAFDTKTLDITYPVKLGAEGMEGMIARMTDRAEAAVRSGYNIIILSDRMMGPDRIPIPALLATAAVHHHLIRKGLRTLVGLVVETGDAREIHHFACLAGYGAEAINPYLAFESLTALASEFPEEVDHAHAVKSYIKSIDKGLLKVMSKMGISTYQSYCGAQIFDAVGLSTDFARRFFTGTASMIEGVGLKEIAEETADRHALAFGDAPVYRNALDVGGDYAYRVRGETHSWSPQSVSLLAACRPGQQPGQVPRLRQAPERAGREAADDPRVVPDQGGGGRRPLARADRGGRGGCRHRAALRDRRHVVRLDLARGSHDPGHRDEPHRRSVEHRRRRRGIRPLPADVQRRFHALGHQAGGIGTLRRDGGIPRQRRHDADQDGPGCQARGGRPVARPQGRCHHRPGAALDARRGPDLAAATPRHLLDRGSGAADLRPEERQPGRAGVGQARVRDRGRHGCGRRVQRPGRPCDDLGLRGRHGRVSADLDQTCWVPLGDRACRNPPDACHQPAALAHHGAGRRRPADRGATSSSGRCWVRTNSASRPHR